jgi:hypothetical protein
MIKLTVSSEVDCSVPAQACDSATECHTSQAEIMIPKSEDSIENSTSFVRHESVLLLHLGKTHQQCRTAQDVLLVLLIRGKHVPYNMMDAANEVRRTSVIST